MNEFHRNVILSAGLRLLLPHYKLIMPILDPMVLYHTITLFLLLVSHGIYILTRAYPLDICIPFLLMIMRIEKIPLEILA